MPKTDAWSAVDDAVLDAFRDGRARTAGDVARMVSYLARHVVYHALTANVQAGRLVEGESSYQITPAGLERLARATVKVA